MQFINTDLQRAIERSVISYITSSMFMDSQEVQLTSSRCHSNQAITESLWMILIEVHTSYDSYDESDIGQFTAFSVISVAYNRVRAVVEWVRMYQCIYPVVVGVNNGRQLNGKLKIMWKETESN
jgi:hypothetical protein